MLHLYTKCTARN